MKMNSLLLKRILKSTLLLGLLTGFTVSLAATGDATPAPDFTLKSRSGENIKLSELRGNVVMVNFWASWCGPCRQEMPLLQQLYDRYQGMGFTLLGVNVDEQPAAALKMLKEIPVDFPILYDSSNKVSKQYQVKAMPSTFMVDRDGNIRHLHQGYKPGYEDDYQQQIRALLKE